jgi:hypothetical protein
MVLEHLERLGGLSAFSAVVVRDQEDVGETQTAPGAADSRKGVDVGRAEGMRIA